MRLRSVFGSILLATLAATASAVTYQVRQDGSGDFTTIQACAVIAQAGDTCLVATGRYDEVVGPANPGAPGNLIRFTADGEVVVAGFRIVGRTYVRIEGFSVTFLPSSSILAAVYLSGAHGSEIVGLDIHDNAGIGIWLHHGVPSNNVLIRNNRIRYAGCTPGDYVGSGGIVCHGNDLLIEGNDISHVGDFTNTWGQRIVLRNNIFHDVYNADFPQYFDLPIHDPLGHHVDAVQHFATMNPLHFLLFENNVVRDVPLANVHGGIFQDQDGTVSDSHVLYRHDVFYELGGAFVILNPFRDFRAVHNSMVHLNRHPPGANTTFSASSSVGPCANIQLVSNLFYESTRQVGWAEPYSVDAGSQAGFVADYNLAYMSGTPNPIEANGVLGLDPRFVNFAAHDYALDVLSPGIDAGGPLPRVAAGDPGTGVNIDVDDAHYFQDGWAGVQPDWIAVGSVTNIAGIVAIDYTLNRITLSLPLLRAGGDRVWLYKNSSGAVVLRGAAPDIGFIERVPTGAPVTGVRAARVGSDVRLTWDSLPATPGYNVWYVDEKGNIPFARQGRAPHALGVIDCSVPSPALTPTCDDVGAVGRDGSLVFYQVRAYLDAETEGP